MEAHSKVELILRGPIGGFTVCNIGYKKIMLEARVL